MIVPQTQRALCPIRQQPDCVHQVQSHVCMKLNGTNLKLFVSPLRCSIINMTNYLFSVPWFDLKVYSTLHSPPPWRMKYVPQFLLATMRITCVINVETGSVNQFSWPKSNSWNMLPNCAALRCSASISLCETSGLKLNKSYLPASICCHNQSAPNHRDQDYHHVLAQCNTMV